MLQSSVLLKVVLDCKKIEDGKFLYQIDWGCNYPPSWILAAFFKGSEAEDFLMETLEKLKKAQGLPF